MQIESVRGRRVWDSRGRPTVEAEVRLAGGALGRAIAPAGASTGSGEALDRRDGGDRFGGRDVRAALAAVEGEIAALLTGRSVEDLAALDAALVELDGTPQKRRLGGNALVAVSMALAHARAAGRGLPLWASLAEAEPAFLPLPEIQIFGGGAHAGGRVDVQDFMAVAVGARGYAEALEMTAEVYRAAGELMRRGGRLQGVADEGGWWPDFRDDREGLELTVAAIEAAGLSPGRDMALSLDLAASEFGRDGRYRVGGRDLDAAGWAETLLGWLDAFPVVSVEDPLAEDDPQALAAFTAEAARRGVQVVGDDALVTSAERVRRLAGLGACDALLVKPNQAGTLSEARAALEAARAAGWGAIVSARSGESEDVTVVHLAVGWGVAQLKVGAFARSERMAKWNEGLRIAEALGHDRLPPREAFPWGRAG